MEENIEENYKTLIDDNFDEAIKNKEFEIYYQIVVENGTRNRVGVESLVRWNNPMLEGVTAQHVISYAESSGNICRLGKYIIEHVFSDMNKIKEHVKQDFYISINLSPKQLLDPTLYEGIIMLTEKYSINPKLVVFEIIESTELMIDSSIVDSINRLIGLGYKFAVDDFGSGYSSIELLTQIDFEIIKIDSTMVKNAYTSTKKKAILEEFIKAFKNLKYRIVIEGIETKEDFDYINTLGIGFLQGYYICEPLNFTDLIDEAQKKEFKISQLTFK